MNFRNLIFVGVWTLSALSANAESLILSDDLNPADGQVIAAPARLFMSFNPEFPVSGNDGPLWQGKGFNSSLSGGAAASWAGFTVELRPEIDFSQNLSYTMLNGPGDYWWGLDRVQSYGSSPVTHFDWGQSELRWTASWFRANLGTKALVIGPHQRNHILASDNAGGFPHLDLGTNGPLSTPWGAFEARMYWGALADSQLYDKASWGGPSNWRFFHGLVLGYSPPFWPELTVGAARLMYSPWATINAFKVFETLVDSFWKNDRGSLSGSNGVDDDIDQLGAIYFDISMTDFRLYGELARNDHAGDLRDYLIQPDHSMGYVVGVQKTFDFAPFQWDFRYEQADLGLNYGTVVRSTGSWYRHGPNPAGYTLGGQLLGAQIGPGSNGQYAEVGLKWNGPRYFFSWERIGNDIDYWVKQLQASDFLSGYVTFISTLGVQTSWQGLDWTVSAALVKELNRYWIRGNDQTTWQASVGVVWNP